jgi:hypothetical protein
MSPYLPRWPRPIEHGQENECQERSPCNEVEDPNRIPVRTAAAGKVKTQATAIFLRVSI